MSEKQTQYNDLGIIERAKGFLGRCLFRIDWDIKSSERGAEAMLASHLDEVNPIPEETQLQLDFYTLEQ